MSFSVETMTRGYHDYTSCFVVIFSRNPLDIGFDTVTLLTSLFVSRLKINHIYIEVVK